MHFAFTANIAKIKLPPKHMCFTVSDFDLTAMYLKQMKAAKHCLTYSKCFSNTEYLSWKTSTSRCLDWVC